MDYIFNGDLKFDPNIHALLPANALVTAVKPHGKSFWGPCGRIDVELSDGTPKSFFVKSMTDGLAPAMFTGEVASAEKIRAVVPDFAPRPIGWGSFQAKPETYFFLAEFREMKNDLPDPVKLAARLAALHRDSNSPNGKFGFHVATFNGKLPHDNGWEDSWETFFSKSLRLALMHEAEAKGSDPEVESLASVIIEKVLPRLLRPLESEGRAVKPSLVHGDLWYGNAGTDAATGEPFVFDACSFYAHNEYELGQWKPVCNRFGAEHAAAYHRHVPKSEPVGDYDGRIDLYKLRFNTHVSALFADDYGLRKQMIGDMKDLIERYGR